MVKSEKQYPSIGCCGIDCSLCPRYHTSGTSICPGCGGPDFKEKHPSCGFLTCCVTKKGHEVCSACNEYPCKRFEPERKGYDSFVTHKKVFSNLDSIKKDGIGNFMKQQRIRSLILTDLLKNYDDGRSKSFFCLSCALLPVEQLQQVHRFILTDKSTSDIKSKNKFIKNKLQTIADSLFIELQLFHKK